MIKNIIILDLETTGLQKTSEVLTIGMIWGLYDSEKNTIIEKKSDNLWFKPKGEIDPGASEAHGLVASDFDNVTNNFSDFLEKNNYLGNPIEFYDYVCGYNLINFDNRYLKISHDNILDVYILSKKINTEIQFHRLSFVYFYYKLWKINKVELHNSLGDCQVTLMYLLLLMSKGGLNDTDLLEYSRKINHNSEDSGLLFEVTFGKKYFGKPYSELPNDYLQWLISDKFSNKNQEVNDQIKKTALYHLKKKKSF